MKIGTKVRAVRQTVGEFERFETNTHFIKNYIHGGGGKIIHTEILILILTLILETDELSNIVCW